MWNQLPSETISMSFLVFSSRGMSTERFFVLLLLSSNVFLINHPLVTTSAAIPTRCFNSEIPKNFCSIENDPHTLCKIFKELVSVICETPKLSETMENRNLYFSPHFKATDTVDTWICDSSVINQLRDIIIQERDHEFFLPGKCKSLCVNNKVCGLLHFTLEFFRNITSTTPISLVDHKSKDEKTVNLGEIILPSEDTPAEQHGSIVKKPGAAENENSHKLSDQSQNVTKDEGKDNTVKEHFSSAKSSLEDQHEIPIAEDSKIPTPPKKTLTDPLESNVKSPVDKKNDSMVLFTNLTSWLPVPTKSPLLVEDSNAKSPLSPNTVGELTSGKNQPIGSNFTLSTSSSISGNGNMKSQAVPIFSSSPPPPAVQKPISPEIPKDEEVLNLDGGLEENDLYKEKSDKDVGDTDAGEPGLEEVDSPLQKPIESSLPKSKNKIPAEHESGQRSHHYSNIPNHGDPYLTEISEDAGYFNYFITVMGFIFIGFILFHNKKRLIALIIEGRRPRGGGVRRRRSSSGGGNGSTSYRKLENNFE